VFRQTERPLTSAERDDLAAHKRTLREVIDRERADNRRNRVKAVWIMVGFLAVFVAIAVGNIATGHRAAALAAGAGVVVFAAYLVYVARPIPMVAKEAELTRLEQMLVTGMVRVYDIEADAAFVLTEQPASDAAAEPFGYVLRVDHDRYVYVRIETCAGLDRGQLPNTRLVIERTEPLGLCRAEIHGAPIVPTLRIASITRAHADTELITDLADFAVPWDELAHRLSANA
jgi:hypothetical protein